MSASHTASIVLACALACGSIGSASIAAAQATTPTDPAQTVPPAPVAPPPVAPQVVTPPPSAPPPVVAYPYAQPQPYGYAPAYGQPYVQPTLQCPEGTIMQPDRRGIPRCMHQVQGHRPIWGLVGAGIGLLGGGYVAEILTTAFSSLLTDFRHRDVYIGFGYIPLIGPWVQMGDLPPDTNPSYYAWLALEGLLQAGGLVCLIVGLLGEDYDEWQPIAGLRFTPFASAQSQGLSVSGDF